MGDETIAETGFRLATVKALPFPRGVYTTPDPAVAEFYASRFVVNGLTYKLLFQNRVNPHTLHKATLSIFATSAACHGCVWEPQVAVGEEGEYWVSPSDQDIRPYGICIKPVEESV